MPAKLTQHAQVSLSLIHSVKKSVLPSQARQKNRESVLKWIDRKSLFLSGKVIRERAYVSFFLSPRSQSHFFYNSCTMTSTPSFANAPFLFCWWRGGSTDLKVHCYRMLFRHNLGSGSEMIIFVSLLWDQLYWGLLINTLKRLAKPPS